MRTAILLLAALCACSQPSFVERIVITNDTDYPASVDVTDRKRSRWLMLGVVTPRSATTTDEVIDHGEIWIFRFGYAGRQPQEVRLSRRELEASEWTLKVPRSFEQHLRDMGIPPPP